MYLASTFLLFVKKRLQGKMTSKYIFVARSCICRMYVLLLLGIDIPNSAVNDMEQ